MTAHLSVTRDKDERIPPRERILSAAGDLFYHHGIRAVGVEAIAEAAGTNKMTLYRHFSSKDELVAECLRQRSDGTASSCWCPLPPRSPQRRGSGHQQDDAVPSLLVQGRTGRGMSAAVGERRGCLLEPAGEASSG